MISKLLMGLGVLALALGAWRSMDGLLVTGTIWLVTGAACEWHRRRAQAELEARKAAAQAAGDDLDELSPMTHGTFLRGTVLLLLAGVPTTWIGWTQWGIDDAAWRWLPLVVGGAVTALAVLSSGMFLLGAGMVAVSGPVPTIPAGIVVESMEQTGVYVNNLPRIELELLVRPDEGEPYRVTKRATVPLTALGSLEVGRGFRAMVAGPEHPTDMDIDWSTPLAEAAAVESLSDRLAELEDLRTQGLVTPEEYDAQRRRLLDSL